MNVSVDLAPNQLRFLEELLRQGDYRSRSEAVRDILRRAEFEWAWAKGVQEAEQRGASEDVEAERDAAFAKLRKRFKDVL